MARIWWGSTISNEDVASGKDIPGETFVIGTSYISLIQQAKNIGETLVWDDHADLNMLEEYSEELETEYREEERERKGNDSTE